MPQKQIRKGNNRAAQALLGRLVAFAEDDLPVTPPRRLLEGVMMHGRWMVLVGRRDSVELRQGGPWLVEFHSHLRAMLRAMLALRANQEGEVPAVSLGPLEIGVLPCAIPGQGTRARILLTASGSVRDRLWFQVLNLIHTAGVDRLIQCECGRVFAKTGRREFCSVKCQKRVYMREVRQKERSDGKSTRTRRR